MLFQQQQQDVTKSFVSCTSHSCIMVQSEQQVPRVPLGRTGMRVSVLGMGCSPLGHSYGEADEQTAIQTVHAAYAAGINFFDVSPFYGSGRAEKLLGSAIKSLPREDVIVCTKIGKYAPGESPDYSAERVRSSIQSSLERLGVDYIDILHCHDIEFCTDMRQIINETLPVLLELKQQGTVRAIGITGYPLDIFSYVLDKVPAGIVDVVLSYCHNSLHDTSLLKLLPYLEGKGVGVISAAPLCMGLWRPQGPESWHPAPAALKDAVQQCAELASAAGLSLPQLAVKAAVDQAGSGVAVHLMGMANPSEVQANVSVILDMVSAVQGVVDRAPAGPADEGDDQPQPQQTASASKKHAAPSALSAAEQSVLSQMREVLQPVKDMTWPVGLTDNRK